MNEPNITEDGLIWSVLDAPRLEPRDWDLFWKKWHEHAGPSYINKPDPVGNTDSSYAKTGKKTEFFVGLNLYAKDPSVLKNGHWELPYLDYREIFPNLLDDIYAACPWVGEVLVCRLWNSSMNIPLHKDHTAEAVTLRAMIYDENTKPTFKVFNQSIGMTYVDLPKESNWFVYNNETCLHGSDKTPNVSKIILLVVHKTKDLNMKLDHLRASAEKYPGHFRYL